jgi:hypothetical protein
MKYLLGLLIIVLSFLIIPYVLLVVTATIITNYNIGGEYCDLLIVLTELVVAILVVWFFYPGKAWWKRNTFWRY